jgi:repressor LexA
VPFYGRIHAGEPALLPDNKQGYITVDRRFLPSDDTFFMRVTGNSMVGRCISDGDYVMVSPSARAKDGDVVAARIGGEATVKTLTHRGMTIVLEPASEGERAIEVGPKDDFAILGVVTGVFRPFYDQPQAPVVLDDMVADQSIATALPSLPAVSAPSPIVA